MAAATTTDDRWGALIAPTQPDSAARRYLIAATAFGVVAAFGLVILSLKIPFPSALENIPVWSYGRLRPAVLNTALWGWVTLSYVGIAYYLTPRLTGAALWGERIANATLWLSIATYAAGVATVALGANQGRAMLEFPLYLDVLVLVTLAIPAVVVTQTVARRTEEGLYVSVWYILGGLYWVVGLYAVGNAPGAGGVADLLQTSFFSSGMGGLWVIGMGVGAIYYLVPKISGSPLYSRPIALIGFWSLAFAQVWVGPAQWIWGPIPGWSQTIAGVMGVALIVPAAAVTANLVGTLRPRWELLSESVPLRFAMAGTILYLVVTVIAALSGFWPVASVIGLTVWSDALWWATVFGVATLWIAGFGMYAMPRMLGRRLYRPQLARSQLRLTMLGVVLTAGTLLIAGFYSGYAWISGAQSGAYPNTGLGFSRTTGPLQPLYLVVAVGALALFAAAAVFGYNVYRTITSGTPGIQEILVPGEPVQDNGDRSDE